MRDDDNRHGPDEVGTDRTDLVSDDALRAWARRLGASPEQILRAVRGPVEAACGPARPMAVRRKDEPLTASLRNG